MRTTSKISLSIPVADNPNRYFSIKLKQHLNIEPSVYRRPKRLFVISNVEGDFQTFCKLLINGNVVNKYLKWTFGDNHLVIVGDCFDRGNHIAECLWLIYSLEQRARATGGCVHYILDNQIIRKLNGDWRYMHPRYAEVTKSRREHAALYNGNNELWHWVCTKNIIEKVGNILFIHGGISIELLNTSLSLEGINNRVRPFYTRANDEFTDPLLNAIFNNGNSSNCHLDYYASMSEELVNAALIKFGVDTIITGHTVINARNIGYNDKVIIDIDHTGINSEALLINEDMFYKLDYDGKSQRIK